jgi:tetratricopeptide (TPR) repeat protein
MKRTAVITLCTIIMLCPITAFADAKNDIAAYGAALDKGDNDDALKLLKQALENAKALPPDDANLALIAYENAYYFTIFEDYETANNALKIVENAIKLRPEIQNGSDLDEYAFLSAFIKFNDNNKSEEPNKKAQAHIAQALDESAEKIKNKNRVDDLLFKANYELGNYYFGEAKWDKLAISAQRQITALEQNQTLSNADAKAYKIMAYTNRGQAKFAHEFDAPIPKTLPSLIKGDKVSNWQDALADIITAEKTYGAPHGMDDKLSAALDGWHKMITTYAAFHNKYDSFKEKIEKVNADVGIDETSRYSTYEQKGCNNWIKADFSKKITFGDILIMQHGFGYVRALYDIDSKNKIRNVRIISSYPIGDFDEVIVNGIEGIPVRTITAGAPQECFKDNMLGLQFVIY